FDRGPMPRLSHRREPRRRRSPWDDKLLKLEISELGPLAELTVLDPKEIGRHSLAEDAAQDAIPAPPASPVARVGQIWQLAQASASVRRFDAPGIRFTLDGQ